MDEFPLRKTFGPINALSYVFPCSPHRFKIPLKYSNVKVLQIAIYLCVFCVLIFFFFEDHTTQLPLQFLKIKTISFVIIFRAVASITVMIILYFMTFFGFKKYQIQLIKLVAVDAQLRKLDPSNYISSSNRSIRNTCIVLCCAVHGLFNVVGGCLSVLSKKSYDSVLDFLGIYTITVFPRLVTGNINLIFYVTAMLLASRFKVINNYLTRCIEESKKVRKYPPNAEFCDDMRYLVDLHKTLVKIAKEINSVYAIYLLVWIAVNFVLLVGDLYVTMYIFFFQLSETSIFSIVNLFKNVLMYAFDLFILAKYTTDLCEEANSTKRLIVRMKIDIDKEDERNSVIVGALKLGQNSLDITACRFFNIDNALLFSICGAASSYLFIMIQLDMGSMNGTDVNSTTMGSEYYANVTVLAEA